MGGGGGYKQDYDEETRQRGQSRERYVGGGWTEKEFWGNKGTHHKETTHESGAKYRYEDDGTKRKRS